MLQDMSRRKFIGISAAAVGGVAGLAACGGGSTTEEQGSGLDSAGATAIGGTVNWSAWANPGEAERFKQYSKQYGEKYGTKVTFQTVAGDYQAKLMTQLAGGSAPDAFYVGDGSMTTIAGSGKVLDLTEYLGRADARVSKDDFFPGLYAWCSGNQEGKLFGLPVDCNPKLFWFNKDMLEKAGISEDPAAMQEAGTWNQAALDEFLKKIKATDKRGMIVEANWFDFFSLMTAFGGTPVAEDGTIQIDKDDKSMAVLEWLWKHFDNDTITFGGSLPKGQGVDALFYGQQLASCGYGRWILPNLKKLKFNYDVAPHPSESGKDIASVAVYTAALSVNAGAKDMEPALAFWGNYLNMEGQTARLSGGGNAVPSIKGMESIVTEGNLPAHAAWMTEIAEKGYATPLKIAFSSEVSTNLGTNIDKWIKAKTSAKEFAAKLTSYINTEKA